MIITVVFIVAVRTAGCVQMKLEIATLIETSKVQENFHWTSVGKEHHLEVARKRNLALSNFVIIECYIRPVDCVRAA